MAVLLARGALPHATFPVAQEQIDDTHSGVAALVCVYDHQDRELATRPTGFFHDHHEDYVASATIEARKPTSGTT